MPSEFEVDAEAVRHALRRDVKHLLKTLSERSKGIDEFLEWLFADVAKRPPRLRSLQKCVEPIRYLKMLSRVGAPNQVRDDDTGERIIAALLSDSIDLRRQRAATNSIADKLWLHLLDTAGFNTSSGQVEAQRLLEKAARIFPGNPLIADAMKFLATHSVPKSTYKRQRRNNDCSTLEIDLDVVRPLTLVSRAYGQGTRTTGRNLDDDLSERIYVARCVLKRCSMRRFQQKIADALESAGIRRENGWTYADVSSRVKDYKKRLQRGDVRSNNLLERAEDALVYLWVSRFNLRQI